MKNYQKLLRNIMIAGLIATVALPASVGASTQPTDSQATNEETPTTEVEEEQDGWTQIPAIVRDVEDIYRSISVGSVSGAIDGVLGILGELGLLNPADESARIGGESVNPGSSSSGNPYSHPQSPEEVYDLQRYVDIVRSEIPQKLSQIVFGPQAQESLDQQNQTLQAALQAAASATQGASEAYQASQAQAEQNAASAETVDAEADKAQSSKASQDVLKALAAQNADLAKIEAGSSDQLAQLGKAASDQSTQLNAANTQLGALNAKTQSLAVLSASQNYQIAQVNAALDEQKHYQQVKDSLQQRAAYQSSNLIYIPGLVGGE